MSRPPETPISDLRNLGPKSAEWLEEAGIYTLGDLVNLGAVAAYQSLKRIEPKTSLVLLYALQGAIDDVHWNALSRDQRVALRTSV